MLSQFSRQFFLWVIFQIAQPVSSFQCYVCAPDEGKPEDMYTLRKSFPSHQLQPCSKYNKGNKHQYLLDCPTESNGCLTKFEASGSVMRSCAPIAIEDCKEANGINYCYCKAEGCNTPERKLSDPHKPGLGHSQAAARISSDQSFGRYFDDDEDLSEGSGQWGEFYYDDYNYIGIGSTEDSDYRPHDRDTDDTEYGEGAHDDSDMTEPPPYLDLEEPRPTHKYDRSKVPGSSSSSSTTERAKPSSGARPLLCPVWSLLMLILMSESLART